MANEASRRGLFITLEGVDGGGKSTQIERLVAWLTARGERVLVTSEPEGTPLGEAVGGWLRGHGADGPVPRAEAMLFLAARAQHVDTVIRPALERGDWVICSRFSHSTLAYQCYGLGLDLVAVSAADAFARDDLVPDAVIVLDLSTETAAARRQGREADRIEARESDFHQRVRDGFRALAAADPARVRLVSAQGTPDEVETRIRAVVEDWLAGRAW